MTIEASSEKKQVTASDVRGRILLIGDNVADLEAFSVLLNAAGYAVDLARSCSEGAALAAVSSPSILIVSAGSASAAERYLDDRSTLLPRLPFLICLSPDAGTLIDRASAEGAQVCLVQPVSGHQLLAAVAASNARTQEAATLRSEIDQLKNVLESNRSISVAIGVLMERRRSSEAEVFEMLRSRARSSRRKLRDVAMDVLDGFYQMNLLPSISRRDDGFEDRR